MVYHGPSKGCNSCRKRRVRCDEARPFCGNCVKRKQQHACVYRNSFDAVHKDSARYQKESSISSSGTDTDSSDSSPEYLSDQSVIPYRTTTRQSPDHRTPSPLFHPAVDPDIDSLCFFFNNYVNLPRESQSNIFVEHIVPLWNQAPEDSPLKLATAATAANILQLWRMQGPDTAFARNKYGQTLVALRQAFSDPDAFNSDEILGTMFMLDFYESLNRRYEHAMDNDIHPKAAMALVSSRGRNTFQSETSRRLFTALRARYILFNLQAKRKIDLDEELMAEDPEFDLPAAKLDLILADLANMMYSGRHLFEPGNVPLSAGSGWPVVGGVPAQSTDPVDYEMTFETLLSYLLEINLRLNAWLQSLPESWQPYRIPDASETLHYSIRAVGLYNGLCDVYTSTATAHSNNGWRSSKILVLRLIKHCTKHLDPDSPSKSIMADNTIDAQIQTHVDDICASVPFHIGSRTTFSLPHEHQEYPPVPPHVRAAANYVDSSGQRTMMNDNDHMKTAAAMGGWFVLTPLTATMRYALPFPKGTLINTSLRLEPISLRPGQLEWIIGQVKRIHKIYKIPLPDIAMAMGRGGPTETEVEVEPAIVDSMLNTGGWLGGGAGKEDSWGGGIAAPPTTMRESDMFVDNTIQVGLGWR